MRTQTLHFAVLVFSLALASSTPGFADILPYATIEEVVDQADLVVRGSQESDNTVRVRHVYKGKSEAQTLTVRELRDYATEVFPTSVAEKTDVARDAGRQDLVVFLRYREDKTLSPVAAGAGIKRIRDGRVFAYHQIVNPGGYVLSLSYETDTDCSVMNAWGSQEPLTPEMLEAYIAAALRRSREFDRARSLPDPKKRVLALCRYATTHFGHSAYYAKKALGALVEIGSPALPDLLTILDADVCNPDRYEVVRTLGQLRSLEAVPFLLKEMERGSRCRRIAIAALGSLKAPQAVEPLCALVSSSQEEPLVEVAVRALAAIGDRRATEPITGWLSRGSPHVRYESAAALSRLQDPRAFEPLAKAIGDPSRRGDVLFRCKVLDALYRCNTARAVPICIEHLRSPEAEVAHQARTCLNWTSRELWNVKEYAEIQDWYERQPKDSDGVIILRSPK